MWRMHITVVSPVAQDTAPRAGRSEPKMGCYSGASGRRGKAGSVRRYGLLGEPCALSEVDLGDGEDFRSVLIFKQIAV